MPICIGLPCAISLCEADRPVGLTVTGVMSTYSSLAVLATWLITRRENLDCLTPLSSLQLTRLIVWHEDTKWRTIGNNASTMQQILPVIPPQLLGHSLDNHSPHLEQGSDSTDSEQRERGYRWEHNVITGRSSDKKADDLAQWAPHHPMIDFFE